MTNQETDEAVVRWVTQTTGLVTIKARQAGDRPGKPYLVVDRTAIRDVWPNPITYDHVDTGVPNSEGENEITSAPVMLTEFQYTVQAYGDTDPATYLRIIRSASRVPQAVEPLRPALAVHNTGNINDMDEWINNRWERRAVMSLLLHAHTRDGVVIDTIDELNFDTDRV